MLNVGIGGNRVLGDGVPAAVAYNAGINALARFDRDVADAARRHARHRVRRDQRHPGFAGPASENPTPTADDLIAGLQQLIERAHAQGLKIYGATLTPFEGVERT